MQTMKFPATEQKLENTCAETCTTKTKKSQLFEKQCNKSRKPRVSHAFPRKNATLREKLANPETRRKGACAVSRNSRVFLFATFTCVSIVPANNGVVYHCSLYSRGALFLQSPLPCNDDEPISE